MPKARRGGGGRPGVIDSCDIAKVRIYQTAMARTLRPEHLGALRQFKAGIFQVLAHPTRIHIIEALRKGEQPVGAIVKRVGVAPANLSQHLAVLRSRHLVVTRKAGNRVLYSLRDPLLATVLEAMRKYFQRHFEDSIELLREMRRNQ